MSSLFMVDGPMGRCCECSGSTCARLSKRVGLHSVGVVLLWLFLKVFLLERKRSIQREKGYNRESTQLTSYCLVPSSVCFSGSL